MPFFEVAVDEIEDFVEVNVTAYADDVIPAIGKGIFDGLPRGFGEREVDAGVDCFFYACRGKLYLYICRGNCYFHFVVSFKRE